MADSSELATIAPPPALAVIDWLLSGASEQQIGEALAAKYPGNDAAEIMRQVQQHLHGAGTPDPTAVRGWALLALRRLYQQLLSVGDYDGCRKCIKEITLLGNV